MVSTVIPVDFGTFLVFCLAVYALWILIRKTFFRKTTVNLEPPATEQGSGLPDYVDVGGGKGSSVGRVSRLFIYPVKSCRPVEVEEATVGPYGFHFDRMWMVVRPDEDGGSLSFLSLRTLPRLSQLQPLLTSTHLNLVCCDDPSLPTLSLPLSSSSSSSSPVSCRVWDDSVLCTAENSSAQQWVRSALHSPDVVLVRISSPNHYSRLIPPALTPAHSSPSTSLSDGFPYLLVSEASRKAAEQRAAVSVDVRRFRPNVVVDGSHEAFEEDTWAQLQVGKTTMWGVKACARCKVPRLNPLEGQEDLNGQPTKALVDLGHFYKDEAYFGLNMVHEAGSENNVIRVGDPVQLRKRFVRSLVGNA